MGGSFGVGRRSGRFRGGCRSGRLFLGGGVGVGTFFRILIFDLICFYSAFPGRDVGWGLGEEGLVVGIVGGVDGLKVSYSIVQIEKRTCLSAYQSDFCLTDNGRYLSSFFLVHSHRAR